MKKYNEKEIIHFMISLYCKKKHHSKTLCQECNQLYEYACKRIEYCPMKETKTFCSVCKIHCYQKNQRQKIKAVMKFSGPRMLLYKPRLAINHIYITLKEKRR